MERQRLHYFQIVRMVSSLNKIENQKMPLVSHNVVRYNMCLKDKPSKGNTVIYDREISRKPILKATNIK